MIPCETDISYFIIRILCRGKDDEPAVNAIQDGFRLEPLSTFLGTDAPPEAPNPDWMWPSKTMLDSADLLGYFAYLLKFFDLRESEAPLFERFASIGIAQGKPFDIDAHGSDIRAAIEQGSRDAWMRIREVARSPGKLMNGWYLVPRIRGNSDLLSGSLEAYFKRAVQAMFGIYGTDLEECTYFPAEHTGDGTVIDGSKGDFVLTLPADMPVKGFWSVTVYEAVNQFLVPNELGRYALGDRHDLIVDDDGMIRLHLSHRLPVVQRRANWLPIPAEPVLVVLRMYIPERDVVEARWSPAPIEIVGQR